MEVLRTTALTAGLRQGDILELGGATNPYGCTAGVILTADCDLVQQKHYGHLLVCPLLTAQEYLLRIWLPKRVTKLAERVRKDVRRKLAECDPGLEEISEEYLELLMFEEKSVRAAFEGVDVDANKLEDLIRLGNLLRAISGQNLDVTELCSAQSEADSRPLDKVRAATMSDFRSHLTQDSQEIVVLPDALTASSLAHVILLRSPFSVAVADIGESLGNGVSAKRVATFHPQIKFLIAQKFGFLFSRIGMPAEVERERADCVSILEI